MRSKTEESAALEGLDRLLRQLNNDGIPIGPEEILRLKHVFSLEPASERQSLFNLLACALCKSPRQRRILADDFDLWFQDAEEVLRPQEQQGPGDEPDGLPSGRTSGGESGEMPENEARSKSGQSEGRTEFRPDKERVGIIWKAGRQPWWFYVCLALILTAGIVVWMFVVGREPITKPENGPVPAKRERPTISTPAGQFAPSPEYWTWKPEVRVVPDLETRRKLEVLIALTGVTLAAGLATIARLRLRRRKPTAETPSGQGPGWTPLLPQFRAAANLLSAADRSAAVWNIDKFISEDLTRTLDIRRTVDRTCREAGIPTIHYRLAQYPREIWLWQDREAENSTSGRLVAELTRAFQQFGLPVRLGRFWGTPDLLEWEEGYSEAPLTLEGHRQQAWVFLFTDGAGLDQALASALERARLQQLLRSLSQWPKLQFVDTAQGHYGLPGLAAIAGSLASCASSGYGNAGSGSTGSAMMRIMPVMSIMCITIRSSTVWSLGFAIGRIRLFIASCARGFIRRIGAIRTSTPLKSDSGNAVVDPRAHGAPYESGVYTGQETAPLDDKTPPDCGREMP